MKVIQEGSWKNPWSVEMQCDEKGCNAKLLIEESDVKPVSDVYKYYAECMICDKSISLVADSIPLRVKRIVDKKRKWSSSGWD